MSLITVAVEEGKYAVVINEETGEVMGHRYGEVWQNFSGNKFVYCMAMEVHNLRAELKRLGERADQDRLNRHADDEADEYLRNQQENK